MLLMDLACRPILPFDLYSDVSKLESHHPPTEPRT